jgi:hypothetical protein
MSQPACWSRRQWGFDSASIPGLLILMISNPPVGRTGCVGYAGHIVGLHRTDRSLGKRRIGWVRTLVGKTRVLPGGAALLRGLPWLLEWLILLRVWPGAHRDMSWIPLAGMLSTR